MDSDGFFSLITILSLPKVQALSNDLTFIRQALQHSTKFELSADCLKVSASSSSDLLYSFQSQVRPRRDWIPCQENPSITAEERRNNIDQYKHLGKEINFVIASADTDTESV